MPSPEQLAKEAIDGIQKNFEEFKALHTRELAEIKAKGAPSAETVQAVERANAAITAQEKVIEGLTAQVKEQEKVTARLELLGTKGTSESEQKLRATAAAFFARGRKDGLVPDVSAEQFEAYKKYSSSFNAYLRSPADKSGISQDPGIRNAMTTGTDPDGGYAVPPDREGAVVTKYYETSPIRQFADIETTGRREKTGYNDLGEAGGGWAGETEAPVETDTPGLGEWRIPVQNLYAEPRASSDDLEDSEFDVEGWLMGKVADKLGRLEAAAAVSGNGIKRLRGFLTYPSGTSWGQIEQIPTTASGAFAAAPAGADVFLTLLGTMKAPYLPNFRWAMGRLAQALTRKLKDSDGAYVWQPGAQLGTPNSLFAYPIALFEDMPAPGADTLSIAGADFKAAYKLVDRRGITVLRDQYTAKPWVKFYTTKRVGGAVVNFEAIKLIKFGS